jgi:hypothetical protein
MSASPIAVFPKVASTPPLPFRSIVPASYTVIVKSSLYTLV